MSHVKQPWQYFSQHFSVQEMWQQIEKLTQDYSHENQKQLLALLKQLVGSLQQMNDRLESDLPDLAEPLLERLCPQLVRPMPARAIISFAALPDRLQSPYRLARGTVCSVQSAEKSEQKIPLTTLMDVDVLPLRLTNVIYAEQENNFQLVMDFNSDADINLKDMPLSHLPIYIAGDDKLATMVYGLLLEEVNTVTLYQLNPGGFEKISQGGSQWLQPLSFSHTGGLYHNQAKHPLYLPQQQLLFPEQHRFIDFSGLKALLSLSEIKKIRVIFSMKRPLPLFLSLRKDNFVLYATPAINLFNQQAEPVRIDHQKIFYPLSLHSSCKEDVQIYCIDEVVGIRQNGERRLYHPLQETDHVKKPCYSVARNQREGEENLYQLAVAGVSLNEAETLSCQLRVFNQNSLIEEPSVLVSEDTPAFIKQKIISFMPKIYYPPLGGQYLWRLVSFLSISYSSLDYRLLKELLALFNWGDDPSIKRKIDGLSKFKVEFSNCMKRGSVASVVKFVLEFDEKNYASLGEIYIFGQVLHHFFCLHVELGCFVATFVKCCPSNKWFEWENGVGKMALW